MTEEVVAREFGRDPKVNGYAIFNPDGSVVSSKKLKEDFVKAISSSIQALGERLDSGFLQFADERLMILKTDVAVIAVSFAMTVQIGFIVMMINKVRSQILQSTAGTQPTAAVAPATKAKPAAATAQTSAFDSTKMMQDSQKTTASFEAMGIPPPPSGAKISSAVSTGAKESTSEQAAEIPPPPSTAKVESLIGAETKAETKATQEVKPEAVPTKAAVEPVGKGKAPAVFIPSAKPSKPTKKVKAEQKEPAPPTKQPAEALLDLEKSLNQIPSPTPKFADLWDEFMRSELNKVFGEIALEVLSQVDGISRLATISSRLPHITNSQVFDVIVMAIKEGYIELLPSPIV
ncbi:MAG: hypothetical protein ACTSYO_03175 [Candidatus Ranarchaeia archaeon]